MLGVVLVRVLTCSQERAEVVDEGEISFTTECPIKVIQVQSPDESPPKSVVLQVSDLDTTTPVSAWGFRYLGRTMGCRDDRDAGRVTFVSKLALLSYPTHWFCLTAYGTFWSSIRWTLAPLRKVQI